MARATQRHSVWRGCPALGSGLRSPCRCVSDILRRSSCRQSCGETVACSGPRQSVDTPPRVLRCRHSCHTRNVPSACSTTGCHTPAHKRTSPDTASGGLADTLGRSVRRRSCTGRPRAAGNLRRGASAPCSRIVHVHQRRGRSEHAALRWPGCSARSFGRCLSTPPTRQRRGYGARRYGRAVV